MRENGVKRVPGLKDPTVYNKHLVNNALMMKGVLEIIAEDLCLDSSELGEEELLMTADGEVIPPLICGTVSGNPNDKLCPSCMARDVLRRLQ